MVRLWHKRDRLLFSHMCAKTHTEMYEGTSTSTLYDREIDCTFIKTHRNRRIMAATSWHAQATSPLSGKSLRSTVDRHDAIENSKQTHGNAEPRAHGHVLYSIALPGHVYTLASTLRRSTLRQYHPTSRKQRVARTHRKLDFRCVLTPPGARSVDKYARVH